MSELVYINLVPYQRLADPSDRAMQTSIAAVSTTAISDECDLLMFDNATWIHDGP